LAPINSPQAVAAGIVFPYPGFTGSVAQSLRPYPQYRGVPYLSAPAGFNLYNSLQVNVQKHLGHGLTFLLAYTLSKDLNNTFFGQQGWGAPPVGLQTFNQRRLLKQIDYLDRPQALAISYVYELPFGPGRRFANGDNPILKQVVSGWQFTGIHNYQGGYPIQIGNTQSLPGGLAVWSIRNLGVPIKITSCGSFEPGNPTSRYLNINAFATPVPFTFGNTYTLSSTRTCPYLSENMSLVKSFPIKERLKAVVGVNAFNIFNRHQWLGLQTNIGVPSFGRFTSASNARSVQLYGKINF
jgi:hypothetical protein